MKGGAVENGPHFFSQQTCSSMPEVYSGIDEQQCSDLLKEFETQGQAPSLVPNVYSGVCHHLGQYNPEDEHHAVVMIDQRNHLPQFSTIFSFFADHNEFADWTVETARHEMNDYWLEHGKMIFEENTARVVVSYDDGNTAYVYWMRQNPKTGDLLYITYAGTAMKSFCRLQRNSAGH